MLYVFAMTFQPQLRLTDDMRHIFTLEEGEHIKFMSHVLYIYVLRPSNNGLSRGENLTQGLGDMI